MRKLFLGWLLALPLVSCMQTTNQTAQAPIIIDSPSGMSQLQFQLSDDGQAQYSYRFNGQQLVAPSNLGLVLKDLPALRSGFRIVDTDISEFNQTWEQPWGEERYIVNHYKQLNVSLQEQGAQGRKLNLMFRLFDEGLGFRYEIPEQPGLSDYAITDELTSFAMADNLDSWWTPAQAGNQYEYLYRHTPLKDVELIHTPVTLTSKDGYVLSIHEAALHDYSTMNLQQHDGVLSAALVPWSPQTDVKVKVKGALTTPWRTIIAGKQAIDLINSHITLNLNEPNKLGDVSWVNPGKYVGIWWELHLELGTWKQGDKHGATTANTKKYIDFAAKHGFAGVLVEGWNVGWDGKWWDHGGGAFNFTTPYPDYDLDEVNRYAKEKGVYIIGHHETGADINNYTAQLEDAYALLEKQGMQAVKTGYVEAGELLTSGEYHHGQYFVQHVDHVTQTAASHHIMLVAHETVKDTGERRTYPNLLSREVARGQEYNAWSEDGGNPPSHTTILPFTRLLAGPMDFTPGIFDISLPTRPNNQVNTTLAKQLALYVVIYSPVQMAADLPENYEKHPDALQFIKNVPVDWQTSEPLAGEIGEYMVMARQQRGSDNWFVGAITNEQPRSVEIKLDFLAKNKRFLATIYRDADDADYKTNPTAYRIEQRQVTADDQLNLKLAAGGGVAISIMSL